MSLMSFNRAVSSFVLNMHLYSYPPADPQILYFLTYYLSLKIARHHESQKSPYCFSNRRISLTRASVLLLCSVHRIPLNLRQVVGYQACFVARSRLAASIYTLACARSQIHLYISKYNRLLCRSSTVHSKAPVKGFVFSEAKGYRVGDSKYNN